MGIRLAYTTATDATIERILANPPLVLEFLYAEDAIDHAAKRTGLGKWLFGRRRREPKVQLELVEGEGVEGDLDKAWHGIHFLLTGESDPVDGPLGLLSHSGEVIGDVDVGYGPAFALRSYELRQSHEALQALDDAELRQRFDPDAMMSKEIYPEVWDRGEEELGYLMEYVGILRRDLAGAVRCGMGWVISYA